MHLFLIKPGVDDGDVIDVIDFDINDFDDIETLYLKYELSYKQLLKRNLKQVLMKDFRIISQVGTPSYYSKRIPEDGLIDWETMDVHTIYNFVRAQSRPYPGAFGVIDNKKIIFWKVRVFDTRLTYPEASYGQIVETFGDKLIINCLGGLLLAEDYEVEK